MRPRTALLLFLASVPAGACGETGLKAGATRPEARVHLSQVLESLAARFGPTTRDPIFESLRPLLARYALVPSRIFDAPGIWTGKEEERRAIAFRGERALTGYRMAVQQSPRDAVAPGDYRGEWRLERLRDAEFEWMAREELSLGSATPEDLSRSLTALLRLADSAEEGDRQNDVRRELPRTAAALGRLMTLEALRARRAGGGASDIVLEASLHPESIRSQAPFFAHYLDDVVMGTRFLIAALDEGGTRFWELGFAQGRLSLHFRAKQGSLVPLTGREASLPQSILVVLTASTKTGFVRSGFHDLFASVELTRTPEEKAFTAHFRRAPEWDLPFLVPLLMRSSLRRPFEGDGASLSFALERRPGGPTVASRRYRVVVGENWILKWVSGYVAGAVNEYRQGEQEADRFIAEGFFALRDDLLATLDHDKGD